MKSTFIYFYVGGHVIVNKIFFYNSFGFWVLLKLLDFMKKVILLYFWAPFFTGIICRNETLLFLQNHTCLCLITVVYGTFFKEKPFLFLPEVQGFFFMTRYFLFQFLRILRIIPVAYFSSERLCKFVSILPPIMTGRTIA